MSTKRLEPKGGMEATAAQALALFEESLALLEQRTGQGFESAAQVPALPFASLLDHCETVLQAGPAKGGYLCLLRAMSGVPALDHSWWAAHFAGLVMRQLEEADARDAGFADWVAGVRRAQGCLVLTGTPDVVLPEGLRPDATALLVCHPYRAFHALPQGHGMTLDGYCRRMIRSLERMPDAVPVLLEDSLELAADLAQLLALPDSVTELFAEAQALGAELAVPPYFSGGEAYGRLCAQLGYDPASLPQVSQQVTGRAAAPAAAYRAVTRAGLSDSTVDSPAVISAFLERAAQVRHALAPDGGPFDVTAIVEMLDDCAAQDNEAFLDVFDRSVDQLGETEAALAGLAAGAHFFAQGERVSALNFTATGLMRAPRDAYWLHVLAAAAYSDMNEGKSAVMALASGALAHGVLTQTTQQALSSTLEKTIGGKGKEHGHSLLIDVLEKSPPADPGQRRVMIEIGTTRELVLGQGSTQKLAELCRAHGIHFITVDMDPRNTRNAARMFAREGYSFEAVTAKGEDYLAQYDGVIDYVFLDAYDFDHGNHSEVRQDRYQKFLGGRIEEAQCHQMHLDCAEALVTKMAPDGLICFDDTWTTPEGVWTAKGATAMPYLLAQGFAVIEARNNAALLRLTP